MVGSNMNDQIGEAQVGPQAQQQITPDLVSPQGKQQLFNSMAGAVVQKKFLDFIVKGIATKAGAEFTSRVKDPETVVQKVATKRTQGRDYNLDDVNDTYGARIVIKNSDDLKEVRGMLKKAEDLGVFKVNKQQDVTNDTYHGYHLDIETPDGVKGEIQIQTPQEELEAVANHSLRSAFGEKPPTQVAKLRDMQADLADKISGTKAHQKSLQIQDVAKQVGNKPLDARLIANILQQ